MYVVFILLLSIACMSVRCLQKRNFFYLAAVFFAVLSAFLGMRFSPSYTAIFLFVFYAAVFLAECLFFVPRIKESVKKILRSCVTLTGACFLFPSILIYLHGDNFESLALLLTALSSVLLFFSWFWIFERKRKQTPAKIPYFLELFLLLSASLFALFGGFSSVALLPYGFGIAFCTIARLMKDKTSEWLMIVGLTLTNVFLSAPMVC